MKITTEKLIFLTMMLFVAAAAGCGASDKEGVDLTQIQTYSTSELERELQKTYASYEDFVRKKYKLDQHAIDGIMQIQINKNEIETPYIHVLVNGVVEKQYLTYVEYKKYRLEHPITTAMDTIHGTTVFFTPDSIRFRNILDSDKLR